MAFSVLLGAEGVVVFRDEVVRTLVTCIHKHLLQGNNPPK